MRQRKLFLPIIAAILLFTSTAFAKGVATTMGNLQLVGRDGPFDAMRSPALLVGNKENNGAGLALDYRLWNDETRKQNLTYSGMNIVSTFDKPDVTQYEGTAAFLMKMGERMALGFAYEREFEKTKEKSINQYNHTDTTKKNVNDRLWAGYGMALNKDIALGIQLKGEYKTEKEDEVEKDTTVVSEESSEKTKTMDLSLSVGMIYTTGDTQLGLMLNSGNYSQLKYDIQKYKRDDNYNLSGSVPSYWKYTSGPEVSAGIYQRLNPLFAVAAEAGLTMPKKYQQKKLNVTGSTPYSLYETSTDVDQKITYALRGGVEINATKELTISLGALYNTIKKDETTVTTQKNEAVKITGHFMIGTLGFDYKITSATKINLFGHYQQSKLKMDMTSTEGPMVMNMDKTDKYFNAGLSATQMF